MMMLALYYCYNVPTQIIVEFEPPHVHLWLYIYYNQFLVVVFTNYHDSRAASYISYHRRKNACLSDTFRILESVSNISI